MKKFLISILASLAILIGCATSGALVDVPENAITAPASYESAYDRHEFMKKGTFAPLGGCVTSDYGETFCLLAEATHKITEGEILDVDPDSEFVIQYVDTDAVDSNLDGTTDFAFIMLVLPNMEIIQGRQFWIDDNPGILKELADQFEKQFGYRYEMTWAKTMDIPDGWDPRNHGKFEDPGPAGEEMEL